MHVHSEGAGRPPAAGPGALTCPRCDAPLPELAARLAEALRASESRFRTAFADAGIGMALIGADDRFIEANPALAAMLGRTVGELKRMRVHQVLEPEEGPHRLYRELVAGKRDRLRLHRRLRRRDGGSVWANVTLSLIRDGAGAPLHSLVMVEDVTEQRRLGDRLRFQSLHDPLTRLPNRTLFFQRLDDACGTDAARRRVGVCQLDLDDFQAVNDAFGHQAGDRLLQEVAARLREQVGRHDGHLLARLGGDEFAVLVADSAATEQLTSLAAEVLRALDPPFEVGGHRLTVTASAGVVERPAASTTPTELMKDAETTVHWSKADGRARWTLYDPDRGAHQTVRRMLATALRPALERGEFAVEFQPLVGLADGMLHGVEALARWHHPRLGTLPPDRFIPLAEESGAIVPLGRWVLEESCRQACRWLREFPDRRVFVSVNLAVRQIWDSDVVADVQDVLSRTGLPPALLQLEITESAVMGPAGRPLDTLHALADMGVRIAIDDFGTGYSNLSYLSRLPVHVLKLDRSFSRSLQQGTVRPDGVDGGAAARGCAGAAPAALVRRGGPAADEEIVRALVRLAHVLGLTVTAEGIESATQADRLRATGCDTAQGWYFARPGPPHRVSRILRGGLLPAPQTREAAAGA